MNQSWNVRKANPQIAAAISKATGLHPISAGILAARGLVKADEVKAFLDVSMDNLAFPGFMKDLTVAASQIAQALKTNTPFGLIGDYDADGLCGSALMFKNLTYLGGTVYVYIPKRLEEGYGMSEEALSTLERQGAKIIITVDNGINAAKEVEEAKRRGLRVIITDHHLPSSVKPKADAVVDPKQHDCSYPSKNLSGTGVAFKVMQKVYEIMGADEQVLFKDLDLVALGTVADLCSVMDENRILLRYGLERMANTENLGLRALLQKCNLGEAKIITAADLAYNIAPKINAAGRMGDAYAAFRLLVTELPGEADLLAEDLLEANLQRQYITKTSVDIAKGLLAFAPDLAKDPIVVLAYPKWHLGIVGLVASQMVRVLGKPVIALAKDDRGMLRGSGRASYGVDLYKAVSEGAKYLSEFGGHEAAVGLTLDPANLVAFRKSIGRDIAEKPPWNPPLKVDALVDPREVSMDVVNELYQVLGPFGSGNWAPVFACRGCVIKEVKPMGSGEHARLTVTTPSGFESVMVYFNAQTLDLLGKKADIAYMPEYDHFSSKDLQLRVEDLQLR